MKDCSADFDLTQRTIFGLLSYHLFDVPFEPEAGVDWEAVFRESKCQAVTMQVFLNCDHIPGISEELRNEIQAYLFRSMIKNIQIHAQHTYLHRLLSEHGISYVTLKGAASARYYPDPQSRAMGDVDFYVDKADFEKALALFREEGFESGELNHICHVVLRKKPMHMEMHHTPAGVPDGGAGKLVQQYLLDLKNASFLVENKLVTCCCPSDFHHGLIMLMHLQHHLLAEGIGLRHLCDWAVFVHKFQADTFPILFRDRLRAIGLWKFARVLTLCAVLHLGLPEQAWMVEDVHDKDTACSVMQDILAGGNFGSKDSQRVHEGMFISNRGKSGVPNRRFQQGFQALNRIIFLKYPFFEKYPIFLPFGWILAFCRYLIRTYQRNKKNKRDYSIHFLSAYQNSAPRIRLYQKLAIYEPERQNGMK